MLNREKATVAVLMLGALALGAELALHVGEAAVERLREAKLKLRSDVAWMRGRS